MLQVNIDQQVQPGIAAAECCLAVVVHAVADLYLFAARHFGSLPHIVADVAAVGVGNLELAANCPGLHHLLH